MKKVTYGTSNLFTLKKYSNSNLNCQSYEYPTIYAIRCAILGSIIQLDGIEKAKELFYKVKNTIIYIQYPKEYKLNNIKLKRFSNNSYSKKNNIINLKLTNEDLKSMKKEEKGKYFNNLKQLEGLTTMGFRQYCYLPKIVFYIDNSIPNIELYLKNIDWIGTAESLVYLNKIEETNKLNDVLVAWNGKQNCDIFEQFDWDTKIKFDFVYMYSKDYKHKHIKTMCCIKDLKL